MLCGLSDYSDCLDPSQDINFYTQETLNKPSHMPRTLSEAADAARQYFDIDKKSARTKFHENIEQNSLRWKEASPAWNTLEVHQAVTHTAPESSQHEDLRLKGLPQGKGSTASWKSKNPPAGYQKHRALFHHLSTDSRCPFLPPSNHKHPKGWRFWLMRS